MPWWALILAIVWPVLGFVNVWLWQQPGDGVRGFSLHLITGIIFVPAFLAVLIFWDIQSKMALRKAKKESSDIPAVH